MLELFWELHQQRRIADAGAAARTSANAAKDVQSDLRMLRERVDRLTMICAAMWTFVQAQSGITDGQLAQRIEQIDMTDGRLDGRARRPVATCARCKRGTSLHHQRCIYCGEPAASGPFDRVM